MIFKLNKNLIIFSIIVFSIIFKLIIFDLFIPVNFNVAWEWTTINNNFNNELIFSYFEISKKNIQFSNYMPIFYSIFLVPFLKISSHVVIIVQIILSALTSYFFFRITKKIYNFQSGVIFLLIYTFFPLNVYSTLKFTNMTVFLFLLSIFLKLTLDFVNNKDSYGKIFIFSSLAFLIVITRSEFILVYLITIFFLIIYKKLDTKKIIISFLLFILFASPLILRNINHHGKVIFTAKSFGINFWRGWHQPNTSNSKNINSIQENGTSYLLPDEINDKIKKLENNVHWETNLNKIYLTQVLSELKSENVEIIKIYFNRIFSMLFWFVDHDYPKANHILIVLPWLFVVINFFIYILNNIKNLISFRKRIFEKLIFTILTYYILLFSTFFVIPRYKLFILPVVCIFAAANISSIYNKIIKN